MVSPFQFALYPFENGREGIGYGRRSRWFLPIFSPPSTIHPWSPFTSAEWRQKEIGNSDTRKERDRRQDTSTPIGAPNLYHVISSDWMERSKWVSDHPQERERSNAIVHPSYSQSRSWSWSKNRTNPRWISIGYLIPFRMRRDLSGLRNRKNKEKR